MTTAATALVPVTSGIGGGGFAPKTRDSARQGLPPLALDPAANPPVFLIGCHRSGTTLVRYILDAHPNLCCPPETKFLAAFAAVLSYPQAVPGLLSIGASPDEVLRRLGALARDILDGYAERQGKTRWVDKTPNYYRVLPLLDRMFGSIARYLFIVRHPLDTVDSLSQVPYFQVQTPDDPDIARITRQYGRGRDAWARYWLEVTRALARFARAHQERCYVIRYEDLVHDPESAVASMLAFVGEAPAPGLLESAFSSSHVPGYSDWKIRATSSIHTRSVGKWRGWPAEEAALVWSIVAAEARPLGYDTRED